MSQISTLLFDLDGTLLPMNMEEFVQNYMQRLSTRFTDYLEPKQFVRILWSATNAMVQNDDPNQSNETVFWQHLLQLFPQSREELEPIFDAFYTEEFSSLQAFTTPSPVSREIIQRAEALGFTLILATNPVFPAIATQERMRWAGIQDFPWNLVTTYENSRFCKPQPQYYQDILQYIGKKPQECLMIGNDMQEDMCASTLGIATCLVTDGLIDSGAPQYALNYKSTLAEVPAYLEKLNK